MKEEEEEEEEEESCLSSLLPSSFVVYLLEPEEDNFCRKRSCTIDSLCFVALVSTFLYICSIHFVNLTSSCSLIPRLSQLSSAVSVIPVSHVTIYLRITMTGPQYQSIPGTHKSCTHVRFDEDIESCP